MTEDDGNASDKKLVVEVSASDFSSTFKFLSESDRPEDILRLLPEFFSKSASIEETEATYINDAQKNVLKPLRDSFLSMANLFILTSRNTSTPSKVPGSGGGASQEMKLHFFRKIISQIQDRCLWMINLLTKYAIPAASSAEIRVLLCKMKGDQYRYLLEVNPLRCDIPDKVDLRETYDSMMAKKQKSAQSEKETVGYPKWKHYALERKKYLDACMDCFSQALQYAEHLSATNIMKLGTILNYTVFLHDTLGTKESREFGIKVGKDGVKQAEDDEVSGTASQIVDLLNDNISQWEQVDAARGCSEEVVDEDLEISLWADEKA